MIGIEFTLCGITHSAFFTDQRNSAEDVDFIVADESVGALPQSWAKVREVRFFKLNGLSEADLKKITGMQLALNEVHNINASKMMSRGLILVFDSSISATSSKKALILVAELSSSDDSFSRTNDSQSDDETQLWKKNFSELLSNARMLKNHLRQDH